MADTSSPPTVAVKPAQEQITFRFCRDCSNMLYPKEDRINNTLMFACRTCKFAEPAASSCVFRNILNNVQAETAGVTQDVASDPTVGLSDFCTCTLCGEELVCLSCGVGSCRGVVATGTSTPDGFEENLREGWDETSEGASSVDECRGGEERR